MDATLTSASAQKLNNQSNCCIHGFYASTKLFDDLSIKYIYIDAQMRNGLVWRSKTRVCYSCCANNETFKKIFANQESEVCYI